MACNPSVALNRDLQALFVTGTLGGLTDRQLLERFANGREGSAEAAFEAIVLRHGPMVLRVCRNVLGDSTDAQDAFQATFLVLVKQYGSIKRLDSVGSWLYGVACRVAARARVEAARRRAAERQGALRVVTSDERIEEEASSLAEFGPLVQEEVRRLPEKYRAVVLLCYWQGLTHEQAAAQLGCPLGTVRSRVARARELLRRRLTRRGIALTTGLAGALVGHSATAATKLRQMPISDQLVRSSVRSATAVGAGRATAQVASAFTAILVQRVLWRMAMMKSWRLIVSVSCVSFVVVGMSIWAQQADEPPPKARSVSRARPAVQEKAKTPEPQNFGPPHVIAPPDLLMVEVLEALPGRPISGERLVRPDGTISLGFYGDVQVAGLTLLEAKEKIIRHLVPFLNDESLGLVELDETGAPKVDPKTKRVVTIDPKDSATVFLDITAYNSRYYYVEGEVAFPYRLAYTGNETVLDAIHYVGGLLPSADRSKIRLIRSYPKGSAAKVMPIDYEEVTMGTDSSTNYTILPFDRLVIPRNPDYQSPESGPPKVQQRNLPTQPRGTYFSRNPAEDETSKQLESLRSVEKHLYEVEKKLDRILNSMEGEVKGKKDAGPSVLQKRPTNDQTPKQ
jgi:RNA polymerase sigma factor (sigma-70 family)